MTELLHAAVRANDLSGLIKVLLKHDAVDVGGADGDGQTALHIACSNHHLAMAKYLLEHHHVDASMRDHDGRTALECTPPAYRAEMTLLFSQAEARRQSHQRQIAAIRATARRISAKTNMSRDASPSGGGSHSESTDVLESRHSGDTVSPKTVRKAVMCLVAPLLCLIFYNGLRFATIFITISMAFYLIAAAYFIAEIAIRPPWHHHDPNATSLPLVGQPEYWRTWIHDPRDDFGHNFEEISFKSTDGYVLRGWYVPPPQSEDVCADENHHHHLGAKETTGVVLVHGGGRDRRAWLRHVPFLHQAGFGCLLFDLRDHGLSSASNKGLMFGMTERFDVVAACQFMRSTYGFQSICAMGTSVGGAAVIMAAAIDPSINMVIAENAMATCGKLLDEQVMRVVGGYLSLRWYSRWSFRLFRMICKFWLNVRVGNMPSRQCQAIHSISSISPRPVLLMHGTADVIVPVEHTDLLFAAAKEPKRLYRCEGAFHCGLYNVAPEEYEEQVLSFLVSYGKTGPVMPC